jgi:hypothetical protein
MKVSSGIVDSKRAEAGEWIGDLPELDGTEFFVRGTNTADFKRMQSKLINALPRKDRMRKDGIDPLISERITNQCIVGVVLKDWRGLTEGEDDAERPLPYSKDMAHKFMFDPDYVTFRTGILTAVGRVEQLQKEEEKALEGNSVSSSAGSSNTVAEPTGS